MGYGRRYGFNIFAGGDTSATIVNVTSDDVEYYGLKAPTGNRSDVPIVVTKKDVDFYGLSAPSADSLDPPVNVSREDIERFGAPPTHPKLPPAPFSSVTPITRHPHPTPLTRSAPSSPGLSAPAADGSDNANVTLADIKRYGLVAPSGARLGPAVPVSAADVAELGLAAPAADDAGADRATAADVARFGAPARTARIPSHTSIPAPTPLLIS